jgi:hypothetical protein
MFGKMAEIFFEALYPNSSAPKSPTGDFRLITKVPFRGFWGRGFKGRGFWASRQWNADDADNTDV